jgi:hypothetical protein
MTWWLADRLQTSAGKASGSSRQVRLTRHFFGEGNASEEDTTKVKAQNEQDQSDVEPCLTNDIDGHAKPDQHGRGRCDFGRSSAHPPGRQAFLRTREFAHDRLWCNAAQLSENADLRVRSRASRTQCAPSKLLIFLDLAIVPSRFVHGRFTQFVAISLRHSLNNNSSRSGDGLV